MKKGHLSTLSAPMQCIVTFLIIIISSVVFTALGFVLLIPFTGLQPLLDLASGQPNVQFLRYTQLIQSIAVFIAPALIAAILFSSKPLTWLHCLPTRATLLLLSLLIITATQPIAAWSIELNHALSLPASMAALENWMHTAEQNAQNVIFLFLDTNQPQTILFNILLIAILPGIGEELLFRGTLQPLLHKTFRNGHLAVWFTAIIFSAIHMQFLTFLPRVILGAILGYLLLYGKSIWLPILAHAFNNFLSLTLFYYYRHTQPELNPFDHTLHSAPLWLAILALPLLIALLLILKKQASKEQHKQTETT